MSKALRDNELTGEISQRNLTVANRSSSLECNPMRASEIMKLLKRRPFIPLRIHMTDGESYDIFHPDNIIVSHSRIDIGRGADPNGVVDAVDYCSLLHVVRVEEITKKMKPKSS